MRGMDMEDRISNRAAGVEPRPLQVQAPPAHDRLPWACTTCGRWVPPVQRVYTDEGLFHSQIECLTDELFEELTERYACQGHDRTMFERHPYDRKAAMKGFTE